MFSKKIFIIAEAGVNHNGKINLALKLINEAKRVGADAVKFQIFKTNNYIIKQEKLAKYQKKNYKKAKNQYDLIKKYELSEKNIFRIIDHCKKKKIQCLFSPFDIWGINTLIKNKFKIIKIPSGEIASYKFLKHLAKFNKKLILSTGMASIQEIKIAINHLVKNGTSKKNISILQCNTEYPTPDEDININVIPELKKKFKLNIGLSDHSEGILAPILAVAKGATIIEKHLTLNQKSEGPDHKASLEPHDFMELVKKIRQSEKILGSKNKNISKSEKKNIKVARKSIVARNDIQKNEKFTLSNLTEKRTGKGVGTFKIIKIIGKKAKRLYKKDEIINI